MIKVSDLIAALQKCDPEATVCSEVNDNCIANQIVQYKFADGSCQVYICDNTKYLDTVIKKSIKERML